MQQPLSLYTRSHMLLASYNSFGLVMQMHLWAEAESLLGDDAHPE